MKHCVALLVIWFELVSLTLTLLPSYATEYRVGVKVGNWAKYVVFGSWDTTNSSIGMPQFVKDAQNTESIQINVTKASYTTATLLVTTQFSNGSEKLNINKGDVRTGSGNLSLQVIAADLGEGDKLSETEGALTVNKTTIKTYANLPRMVNYAHEEEYVPVSETADETVVLEFYWDKSSGIVTGVSYTEMFESEDFTTMASIIMQMDATNIWQPEVAPVLGLEWIVATAVVAIAIISIAFLAIVKMKKGKTKRRSRMPRRSYRLV